MTAFHILVASIFLYLLNTFRDYKRRRGLPYPPGPPSFPVIGNLLDVPKESPWAKYADASKKYGRALHPRDTFSLIPGLSGDVFCIRVFGQVIVVLNSLSAIKDLLEKRGEIYADRPSLRIVEMFVLSTVLFPPAPLSLLEPQTGNGLDLTPDQFEWICARGTKVIGP
jgi:hypothetical protein